MKPPSLKQTLVSLVGCPLLLIHGTDDEVVPFQMRDRLASAAGGTVVRFDVRGAGHNNLFQVDAAGVIGAVDRFLRQLSRASGTGSSH